MCSQNNIKPTDVLTNLWHMFVYSGFRCLQFSGALLSRRTVFTNAGVNTGGEIGTNSQQRKQAHLVRARWKPRNMCLHPRNALTNTCSLYEQRWEESQQLLRSILTVPVSQRPMARISAHFKSFLQSPLSISQTCTLSVNCELFYEAHRDAIVAETWIYWEHSTTASELQGPICGFPIAMTRKNPTT